jgi:hypothetical protein
MPSPKSRPLPLIQSLLGYRFRAVWPLCLRVVDAGLESIGQHTQALGGPRVLAGVLQACCVCISFL